MKNKYINLIINYLIIIFGVAIAAYAVSAFYLPNKIVSGGVSGISTILFYLFGIRPGISYAVINAILLIMALIFLGKDFVLKTVLGAGLFSLLVQIFSYLPAATDDVFLATVFGSVMYGIGIGITLVRNASTGGTDILGRLLQYVFPQAKIGSSLILVDVFVVAFSLLTFKNVNLTLYGIIALLTSGFAVNCLVRVLNVSKLAFIVTNMGDKIAKKLISTSHRGVTVMNVTGAYTMTDKYMLMCALKESELPEFQAKILDIDPDAFIIFSEAQQIIGNGFYVYR